LKVLLVDPTPRALVHFQKITERFGQSKISEYSQGGQQSVDSYDLTKLKSDSLKLIPQAIWESNGVVPFYEPLDEAHVSHSIVNFQNNYAVDTRHIDVEAVTLRVLLDSHSIDSIPLIKLDIEGAEIEVIGSFLNDGIFPDQILVEYDELYKPSIKTRQRIIHCHKKLLDAGYLLVNYSKPNNFLYLSKVAFDL
jgi:FkbM family methyltransferase